MTDHQEEMLALHAMRTLSPEEVRLLESEAKVSAKMREALEEFEQASAELAAALPPELPPEEVRSQLLAAVKSRRSGAAVQVALPFRLLRSPLTAWAAAAAVALAALGLWTRNRQLDQRVLALTQSETAAQGEVAKVLEGRQGLEKQLMEAEARAAVLNSELEQSRQSFAVSRMEVAMLKSTLKRYDDGTALVVWNQERQEGLLKLDHLPPPQPNKDYQLWIICRKCQHPVSAGVVKVGPDGVATLTFKPSHMIEQALKFAISVEAQGGVPEKSPDGPIIFASR